MSISILRKHAWVILAVGDLGVLLYGILILIKPGALLELGYEWYSGSSWASFQQGSLLDGEYFSLVVPMLGAYSVAWAWWSLSLSVPSW